MRPKRRRCVPLGLEDRFRIRPAPEPERRSWSKSGSIARSRIPGRPSARARRSPIGFLHDLFFVGGRLVVRCRRGGTPRGDPASRPGPLWRGRREDGIAPIYNQASLVVHPCPEEGFVLSRWRPSDAALTSSPVPPPVRKVSVRTAAIRRSGDLGRIDPPLSAVPRAAPPRNARACADVPFRKMAERTLCDVRGGLVE